MLLKAFIVPNVVKCRQKMILGCFPGNLVTSFGASTLEAVCVVCLKLV